MRITKYRLSIPILVLLCIFTFAFADEGRKVIEAVEGKMAIYYNGNLVQLDKKPLVVNDTTFSPLRAVANLLNKSIEWNPSANSINIGDKQDPLVMILKEEQAKKDIRIKELEEKVKQLEDEASKKVDMDVLENKINEEFGTYEGMSFLILLAGNDEEIRVKLLTDLSEDQKAWNQFTRKRSVFLDDVCSTIAARYPNAKIKGYFSDMEKLRRLLSFYNTPTGEVKIGSYKNYSTISTLEDRINSDYSGYLNDICLAFELSGNENRLIFDIYIQYEKYEKEWGKASDNRIKSLMGKITTDIEAEFRECYINGNVLDTNGKVQLASCWKEPGKNLDFAREK